MPIQWDMWNISEKIELGKWIQDWLDYIEVTILKCEYFTISKIYF